MQIPLIELSPVNTTTPRKTNSPLYILDHKKGLDYMVFAHITWLAAQIHFVIN